MASIFPFPSLSKELQLLILETCDLPTLFSLCLTNKDIYTLSWPILWRTINLTATDDIASFFSTCASLLSHNRERFEILASRVEELQLSRLPGPRIDRDFAKQLGGSVDDYTLICGGSDTEITTIFDIIVHFTELKTFAVFLKNDWDGVPENLAQNLSQRLTKLKTLKLGGQIGGAWAEALLSRPAQIEQLALINLVEQCSQEEGPDPLVWTPPLSQRRFSNLQTLHLSKLADIDIRTEYDGEPERECLQDWAGLLRNVCRTLTHLTLEMCYTTFNDGRDDDSDDFEHSEEQCRDVLLPVLLESEWPSLQQLTLVGLDVMKPLDSMPQHVSVEYLPKRMVGYNYDATPLDVSPPDEVFFEDD